MTNKEYYRSTVTIDSTEELRKVMFKQDDKGVEKYGTNLSPDLDYRWGTMADEEMADFIKYRHCQKECLSTAIKLLKNHQKNEHSDYVELALKELDKCL